MRLSSSRATALTHRPQQDFPLWDKAGTRPSLDLQFADRRDLVDATTGSNLVDFTRQSSGTYVGSDGLIKTATTNLLTYSEEFDNAAWAKAYLTEVVTPNTAITPNGLLVADQVASQTGSTAEFGVGQFTSVTANQAYTFSVFAKAATSNYVYVRSYGGTSGNFYTVIVDLSNGAVTNSGTGSSTTNASYSVVAYPDGWYRIACTATHSTVGHVGIIGPAPSATAEIGPLFGQLAYAGDSGLSIHLWGAQLEQSTTVGEYVKTTSTINSAPRFNHNPTTGESLGLLVEESRTNLLTYSEDFSNAAWDATSSATKVSATGVDDPAGRTTASTWRNDGTTYTDGGIRRTVSGTSGLTYTYSAWIRRRTGTGNISMVVGQNVSFDVTSQVTSEWNRISVTNTADAITRGYIFIETPGDEIDIWGAQLEAGSFPTSYIPTTSSTVTRAADVASISGSNFSSWYRQDEGTVFSSYQLPAGSAANTSSRHLFDSSDGTTNNRFSIRGIGLASISDQITVRSGASTVAQFSTNGTSVGTASRSIAAVYRLDDYAAVATGSTSVVADTSGALPVGVNQTNIGGAVNGAEYLTGTIRRLTYWPQRLPNEVLQTITQ